MSSSSSTAPSAAAAAAPVVGPTTKIDLNMDATEAKSHLNFDSADDKILALDEPPPPQQQPKRGRGRPRKNPLPSSPPPPLPQPPPPDAITYSSSFPFRDKIEGGNNFAVGDLVWGRVGSNPLWWPGQVFDPSAASDSALSAKAKKNGGDGGQLLVAYYGDNKAFGWNAAATLLPYNKAYFSALVHQSGTKKFVEAVDASVDEVASRVRAALSGSCLGVKDGDLESLVFENTGLKEGTRVKDGDRTLIVSSFMPGSYVDFIKELAVNPCAMVDRLDVVVANVQLKAYCQFKCFPNPPEFENCVVESEVVENGDVPMEESPEKREKKEKKKKKGVDSCSPAKRRSRRKRDGDGDSDYEPPDRKKHHDSDSDFDSDMDWRRSSGVSSGSVSRGRGRKRGGGGSHSRSRKEGAGVKEEEVPTEDLSPVEMLSKLSLVAVDPKEVHGDLPGVVSFFAKYKDSLTRSSLGDEELLELLGGKKGKRKSRSSKPGYLDVYSTSLTEDSYWSDLVVDNVDKEPTSKKLKKEDEKPADSFYAPSGIPSSEIKTETLDISNKGNLQEAVATVFETPQESTPMALVLKFSNSESIPSKEYLNNIFRVFGPLREEETEIIEKSNSAKVVFNKTSDAEVAFSSVGKYSIFGPAFLSYELRPKVSNNMDIESCF